jgi:hypothetical protein
MVKKTISRYCPFKASTELGTGRKGGLLFSLFLHVFHYICLQQMRKNGGILGGNK